MLRYLEKHPFIMIVIGVFGISLSSIFVRFSAAPSEVTAAWRLLWTVILMFPAIMKKSPREELKRLPGGIWLICIISGIFLAIHFKLWFESLYYTTVASSTAIVCTEVIWVSIGYCVFMKGKIPVKAVAAIVIALLGSVLIAYADSTADTGNLFGDILALLSAVAVAVYMLLGREARKTTSTTVYTYIVYFACAVSLLMFSFMRGERVWAFGESPIVVGVLLAVFSTILGHSIFSWCLRFFSPSFVSASKLCEPVVASIIAVFLFQEIPGILQVIGGLCILGAVLYYSRIENRD